MPTVTIIPLAPGVPVPEAAPARTRSPIPQGYGVQEQCLPFTAASALGFLIPSPIDFGYCRPDEAPAKGRTFRSPIASEPGDDRVFYVVDRPESRFAGNAWEFQGIPGSGSKTYALREPGISFFDREDQQDLFKLHLPYIWRTPEGVDTLFGPLLNRECKGVSVLSGLVETDWYASPVNLILRKPAGPVHFQAGEPVGQAILVPRECRRPSVEVATEHARLTRETRKGLAEWDRQHAENQSAYKILARSREGRIEEKND